MIRTIVGFHADSEGDWVAELSCWHNQHVRHRPPFQERPWVQDPTGRAARIDSSLDCPPCDRAELPEGLVLLNRLGPWDHDSMPAGLRRAHRTPEGRWGRLRLHEGAADFQFEPDTRLSGPVVHLDAGSVQVIPPAVPHHLVLRGPVRLELELWGPPP